MSDITIANIPREKELLDGSEWFEGQDGGGSFKSRIYGIRGTGVLEVTTAATSQDVGPIPQLVEITTGGTGAEELLNLVSPPLDVDGYVNAQLLGSRINVVVVSQTDPADSVRVTINGSNGASYLYARPGGSALSIGGMNTIVLDYVGAFVSFVWVGDTWLLDGASTDYNFDGDRNIHDVVIQPPDVSGSQGKSIRLIPGQGDAPGLIYLGQSGSALPTSDPHDLCALWIDPANGYVLKVSQG